MTKNTLFDFYTGPRLPVQLQHKRLKLAIREELTLKQRQTLEAYYLENKTLAQIAEDQGVNKSTVWRTLKRSEQKLRRFLRY